MHLAKSGNKLIILRRVFSRSSTEEAFRLEVSAVYANSFPALKSKSRHVRKIFIFTVAIFLKFWYKVFNVCFILSFCLIVFEQRWYSRATSGNGIIIGAVKSDVYFESDLVFFRSCRLMFFAKFKFYVHELFEFIGLLLWVILRTYVEKTGGVGQLLFIQNMSGVKLQLLKGV